MAITDLQISEELMTNAPSIKYRGNEGPKSPEEERMMMVDEVLDEAYEQYIYDLLEQRPDATPMSKEEFKRMIIAEGMMSGGNPLPEDPTKPVNPFQPKPIGPFPSKAEKMDANMETKGEGNNVYAMLRSRLPQEITDDVVKLIAYNKEAFADFASIKNQEDVNSFNEKYGVELVIDVATV